MALPVVIPDAAGACDTHVVPFEVRTLPFVPAAVKPVPPRTAGKDVVKPVKSASQEAAVVPVINIQVNKHVVFGVTVATKLLPDELTVRSPVELLWIENAAPRTKVDVTGSTIVCVVAPVKN